MHPLHETGKPDTEKILEYKKCLGQCSKPRTEGSDKKKTKEISLFLSQIPTMVTLKEEFVTKAWSLKQVK